MRKLTVQPDKCSGCEACMAACSFAHEGTFCLAASRIRIEKNGEGAYLQELCRQCADAPCAQVCPVEALHYDTVVDLVVFCAECCIGCGLCVESCPHSAIRLRNALAQKCDLCAGEPACARVCNAGALTLSTEE